MGEQKRGFDLAGVETRRSMVQRHLKGIGIAAGVAAVTTLATFGKARAEFGECFLKGTRILTPSGERPIEELEVGDLLPTALGGLRPIRFIKRYRYQRASLAKPWTHHLRPVRIAKSAIFENVPHDTLFVSQGHALYVDGVLVPAANLVNERTITIWSADERDELEFFHVMLDSHNVIYAEGLACETLLRTAELALEAGDRRDPESYCAPAACKGARSAITSRVRSLMSPVLGPQQIDLIRERLDARMALLQHT
jgi:hypothetical protein